MLSAVTYTYNDHAFVAARIPLLRALGGLVSELLVVDDGSASPLLPEHCDLDGRTVIVRHARNLGPAAAKRTGLARARGGLILSFDSDVTFDQAWLRAALEALREDGVALVGARIVTQNHGDCLSRALHHESRIKDKGAAAGFAPGGLWLLDREAFLRIGGLDDYHRSTHEDWHLCRKLAASGYAVRVSEEGEVLQTRRLKRAQHLRRELLYFYASFTSCLQGHNALAMPSLLALEMREALGMAERFDCCLMCVYLIIAKFAAAFARYEREHPREGAGAQAAFRRAFAPYGNILKAVWRDCALPPPPPDAGLAPPLPGFFGQMAELAGKDALSRLNDTLLPLSDREEAAGGFDFHFTTG